MAQDLSSHTSQCLCLEVGGRGYVAGEHLGWEEEHHCAYSMSTASKGLTTRALSGIMCQRAAGKS